VKYDIEFTAQAVQDARSLKRRLRKELKKKLAKELAHDPEACSFPLPAPLLGWRSFPYQDQRVIFRIFHPQRKIAVGRIGKHLPNDTVEISRRLESLALALRLADHMRVAEFR
jgi:mRNA-degrading endonuclease RelE of RelBE toxin-antitoxin system